VSAITLTSAQRRIWFAEQFRDVGATYVLDASLRLRGPLDTAALQAAIERLADRHPMLRMRVIGNPGGVPEQWISSDPVRLRHLATHGATLAERRADAEARFRAEVARPMDVTRGPVFAPVLIEVAGDEHLLVMPYHHLAGDGESHRTVRGDLMELYEAARTGMAPDLPLVVTPYFDFVRDEDTGDARAIQAAALASARDRLAGAPGESTVPGDRPRPARPSPAAHCVRVDLDRDLTAAVADFARARRVTPFIVHSAALHLMLQRYSGQTETLVGFMTANRTAPRRRTVGLYSQTVVQRLSCSAGDTVGAVLRRLRTDILADDEQRPARLEDLVESLGQTGVSGHHPLFQAMINVVDPGPDLVEGRLTATPIVEPAPLAWLDLEFRLHPRPDGSVEGWLRASADRYDRATAERVARHFRSLVAAMVAADPDTPAGSLAMLGPDDRTEVFAAAEGPVRPVSGTLTGQLRAALHRHPDRPAVTFEGVTLTYGELARRAYALAGRLAAGGIGPGSLIAVSAPRSIDLVVALTGVTVAGAAYLPIDPDEPAARRAFMLADLRPAALLGIGPAGADAPPAYEIDAPARADAPALADPAPDDLAYVIYTSGSTGQPKAAGNTQLGIVNRLAWMQDDHRLDETDAVVQKTPFTFDVSVWEFFWPLLTGARLVVARPGGHRDPAYLAALLRAERITTAHFVPSMLRAFLGSGEPIRPLPLRRVICSGEALPPQVAEAFLAASDAELHNLYGPTEAAIDVTRHRCRPGNDPIMPIGRAVPNTRVLVLDTYGEPAPLGGVGELHLGGVQLARGYLNRPELTVERFIDDPHRPGERLYRTGDLGRMRPDGTIEYLGRTDRQIKLRGFRVEPGEIEAAVEAIDGVDQAVVDVLRTGGAEALVAFVATTDPSVSTTGLVAALAARLPAHLMPGRIHLLPELPLSRNGKVDQAALVTADAGAGFESAVAAPGAATPVEERLLAIVRTVVGRPTAGVTDPFFAVGGDSIRSIELVARARAEGLVLTVEDVFSHPSARQLAAVARATTGPEAGQVEPFALLDRTVRHDLPADAVDAFPLSPTLAGLLVESTRPDRYRVYTTSLRLRAALDPAALERSLTAVLRRHPFLRSAIVAAPNGIAGEPRQVVYARVPAVIAVHDLRELAADKRDRQLRSWLDTEATIGFDWARPPLVRLTAHRLTGDEFQLTLAEPYLDGFSAALVLTELLAAYQRPGEPIGAEVRGYADYLAEQRTAIDRSAGFWRDQLADSPLSHVHGLSTDVDDPVLAYVDIDFPADVSAALTALNRATGVPLKSILLAAHVRAVAAATAQAEVVTGLMANARPATTEGAAVVGLFLNATPVRTRVDRGTWWDLVEQVQAAEAATLPHRAYPFAQLRRDRLVDGVGTLFNFTHFHPYDRIADGGSVRVLDRVANDQTYFPLTAQFQLDPLRRTLALRLEFFGADLTTAGRTAVAALYRAAVTELARAPHSRHDEVALAAGPGDRQRSVLAGPPAAPAEVLHRTFAATVARHPDRVAVRGGGTSWTFAELADHAERITAGLRAAGLRTGEPVGVCRPRDPWLVAAVLGTLRAGGVYLPLDPALPAERRTTMIDSAGCRLVVAAPATAGLIPGDRTALVPEQLPVPDGPVPAGPADPEQPAYLVFTSGSTGKPKGVLVSHRAVANRLAWGRRQVPFAADDVLAARTPIAFVDSVAELLAGPLAGGVTDLVADGVQDPAALVEQLAASGTTRVTSVPTLLAEVLRLDADLAGRLSRLRHWTVSGEALPTDLVHAAARRLPHLRLLNLYGSTEVAADATAYPVRGDESGSAVPIGRPIDGGTAAVTDPWGNPVPRLIAGQLVVGGAPVGSGYLGDDGPGGFVVPASGSAPTGFRTGDLARVDSGGELEYLGRTDRQLKIRGVRLEPAEIEAVLRDVPGVHAAVVAADGPVGALRCTGYLVLAPGAAVPEPRRLRQELRRRLPAAAIPDDFALLDRLTLTVTGKVDHRALRGRSRPLRTAPAGVTAPATLVERELATLWQARLGSGPVGRDDDFFDSGGHSLQALLLIASARQRLGVELTLAELFDHPTLAEQAELIEERLVEEAGSPG
jgi:amino acid adenylation domain-containing protein